MLITNSTLKLNPGLTVKTLELQDGHRCAIVDDFLQDPQRAVAYAHDRADEFLRPVRSYPGIILRIGPEMLGDVYRFIRSSMSRQFAFLRGDIKYSAYFGMTTLQPQDFVWQQRLCHVDPRVEAGRDNYAALVYLFDNPLLGGTGFYNWKEQATLREAGEMERQNPGSGLAFLRERFAMFREPARYMTESNEIGDLVGMVPAKFNRFVFYTGDLPHSAYITDPALLSEDVDRGRLTLNCFASVWPRS